MIEEIVVTAQKREQTLREVPISMSVVNSDFIAEQGITDFRDLAKYAGNVTMNVETTAGSPLSPGANIRIRGFGTSIGSDMFEQSVGMAIDGDSYTKLPPFLGGLFDVDRVEVLKGPQGTLFGKNTTAGLINMTTKTPTDELSGFLDVKLGQYDMRRFEGAVGGPVIANFLNVRLAGLSEEREGWMENTTAKRFAFSDPLLGGRDRKGIRARASFPDLYGVRLDLTQEFARSQAIGCVTEQFRTDSDPTPVNYYRKYDPNVDFEVGNHIGSVDGPCKGDIRTRRFVANASYDLGGWDLNGLIGNSKFDSAVLSDGEQTPAPATNLNEYGKGPQTNFELRLSSPSLPGLVGLSNVFGLPLGESRFTLGFFHQRRSFDSFRPFLADLFIVTEFIGVVATQEFPPEPPGSGPAPDPNNSANRLPYFFETDRSYAGFGQLTWNFLPRWTLEFGSRFTRESKDGEWNVISDSPRGQAFWSSIGFGFFQTAAERAESGFTPKVALIYAWTDDVDFFGSWGKGFKSGGFNVDATDPSSQFLEFEPETATSWDLGMKSRLLGGSATVDLAFFWETVNDMQVRTLIQQQTPAGTTTPIGNFVVANAGKARSRGFELDTTWLPTEWLTIRGAAALADTRYLSFILGSCEPTTPNTDGDEFQQCDLTGRGFEYTPEWTATLTPQLRFPFRRIPGAGAVLPAVRALEGVDLVGGLTGRYEDVQYVNRSLVRVPRQPSFFKFDANLGFGDATRGWSAGLYVDNLTDKYTMLNSITTLAHTSMKYPAPPRTIYGGIRWEF